MSSPAIFSPPGSVVGMGGWPFTHSATGTSTVKDQLFAYLRTAIEKQLLKDVACAGRGSSGCERDAATWRGAARARSRNLVRAASPHLSLTAASALQRWT